MDRSCASGCGVTHRPRRRRDERPCQHGEDERDPYQMPSVAFVRSLESLNWSSSRLGGRRIHRPIEKPSPPVRGYRWCAGATFDASWSGSPPRGFGSGCVGGRDPRAAARGGGAAVAPSQLLFATRSLPSLPYRYLRYQIIPAVVCRRLEWWDERSRPQILQLRYVRALHRIAARLGAAAQRRCSSARLRWKVRCTAARRRPK